MYDSPCFSQKLIVIYSCLETRRTEIYTIQSNQFIDLSITTDLRKITDCTKYSNHYSVRLKFPYMSNPKTIWLVFILFNVLMYMCVTK